MGVSTGTQIAASLVLGAALFAGVVGVWSANAQGPRAEPPAALPGKSPPPTEDRTTTPRYLIYPVTTDLHRVLVPAQTDLCVALDTSEALKDKKVSPAGLDLENLRKELLKQKVGTTELHFYQFNGNGETTPDGHSQLVHYAIIGFAYDLGFRKITASGITYANGIERKWVEYIRPVLGKDRPPPGDEKPLGNADVKVYPVQTDLSRCLLENADCLVVFVTPLDTEKGKIPEKIRAAAVQAITDLKLPAKKRISFWVANGELTEDERTRLREDLNQIGKEMGSVGGYITNR